MHKNLGWIPSTEQREGGKGGERGEGQGGEGGERGGERERGGEGGGEEEEKRKTNPTYCDFVSILDYFPFMLFLLIKTNCNIALLKWKMLDKQSKIHFSIRGK